jgi:transposase
MGYSDSNDSEGNPVVHLHADAKLTAVSRRLLVERVRELGGQVTEAAQAAGVSRQTAHKWLARYDAEGEVGLEDRSCRPQLPRRKTARRLVDRMVRLRRRKKAAWEISAETGVPTSTVSRHLQAQGLGRLWRIDAVEPRCPYPPLEAVSPIRLAELRRVIQLLRSTGADVAIAASALHPAVDPFASAEVRVLYEATLRQLAEDTGSRYLPDLVAGFRAASDRDFCDYGHVNAAGGEAFTSHLLRQRSALLGDP